jgi:anaerobic magnesium-protoporphyrin IX monomethyl ester cyclase
VLRKVLLVNPPGTAQDGFSNPPLGLLYLAGTLLKRGLEVRVVDGCLDGFDGIRDVVKKWCPGIVGITCLTPGRNRALEVARLVKECGSSTKVVLGGAHPTIMYRQLLEHHGHVDAVVLGEGEMSLLEIAQGRDLAEIDGIAFRRDAQIVKTRQRKYVEDLDQIPFPAWALIDIKRYSARGEGIVNGIDLSIEPRVSVIFSRGCVGHCDFCSTWWIWRGWRHRSASNMADELELLREQYGLKHFCFADDALTIDRQATIDLCDEIRARSLKIAFFATTRTDCVDEEVLHKLKEAGCYQVSFGIETGSPELLRRMNKENDIENSERAIALSRKVGLRVSALLIVGNVGETAESVKETVGFLKRTRPDEIGCVGGLWVLPGTKVYRECRRSGLVDDEFWLGDAPYKLYTREHSVAKLERFRQEILCWDSPSGLSYAKVWGNRIRRIATDPVGTAKRVVHRMRNLA